MASSTPRSSPISENLDKIPWGVRFLRFTGIPSPFNQLTTYRISILLLTYIFYVNYHLARRPFGVVKNVLRQECSNATSLTNSTDFANKTCAWEPFDQHSQQLFSALDFIYRFFYAAGMIAAGYVAERTDLRLFISFGMLFSGVFAIFNGMAYFWNVHSFSYFAVAQFFGGIFQGTGWPSVVPLMGNWFGKHRLGFIFGIWNSHTSIGNILGAVIAGVWVNDQWGYSFIVPGLMIAACGLIAYLFVVVHPNDIALPAVDHFDDSCNTTIVSECTDMSICEQGQSESVQAPDSLHELERKPISIWHACKIPGVVEFSLCLFFSKAVYYTFFFWLPVYIKVKTDVGNDIAAHLSAVFDAGGIAGGIIAGAVSDSTGGSATVCGVMFVLAIPSLYCMVLYVEHGIAVLITLLIITGLFINGPYALITTAVSTDLGTRPSLTKNQKSLATVAAVIDGMGSLGSAVGPLGAGLLSSMFGWDAVFYYLIIAQIIALFCLTRLIYREILHWVRISRPKEKQSSRIPNQFSDDVLTITKLGSQI